MKKLKKLSLLGDFELLSKAELKQLVGSDGFSDGCSAYTDSISCNGTPCDIEGNTGYCNWVEDIVFKGCICSGTGPIYG